MPRRSPLIVPRAVAVAVVLGVACGLPRLPSPLPGDPLTPEPPPSTRPAETAAVPHKPELGSKRVARKELPSRLVADDGMACDVSAKRFADTEPGDAVWCVWRVPAIAPRP